MSEFDQITSQVKLNKSQRRFCKISMTKNVRLLAPAGSGKTFSLLWRCKYLIEESIKKNRPEPRFLIVTFTRSAKYELEDRLKNRPEFQGIKATVKTLNGWGWEQNKNTGKKLIVGRKGRKELVSNDLQKLCKEYPGLSPLVKSPQQLNRYANDIIDIIDQLKSLGFSHTMGKRNYRSHVKQLEKLGLLPVYRQLEETLWRMENLSTEKAAVQEAAVWEFFEFFKKAVVQLENNNRFTMEDQKYWARMNLEKKIKEKSFPQGGARYTHLFVDEFQDVNPLDVALLKAISLYHGRGDNISMTIVGDDDQAIFGWRGTTPEYILHHMTSCVLLKDTGYSLIDDKTDKENTTYDEIENPNYSFASSDFDEVSIYINGGLSLEFGGFVVEEGEVYIIIWALNMSDKIFKLWLKDLEVDGNRLSSFASVATCLPNGYWVKNKVLAKSVDTRIYYDVEFTVEINEKNNAFVGMSKRVDAHIDFPNKIIRTSLRDHRDYDGN